MAAKPESVFRKRFTDALKLIPNSFFISIQQASLSGHPDKIGVVNGYLCALELKRGGLKLKGNANGATKLQNYHLQKFREAGAYANVVRPENSESVLAELRLIASGSTPNQIQEGKKYE